MKLSADLIALQDRIGHRFGRPELILRAVTHASMSGPNRDDNQRLEFLGDRVLGLADGRLQLDATAASLKAPDLRGLYD